ncbi:MAG: hypothetical protein ACYCQK_02160 [Acidiferrobacteraceae bacterium]
MKKNVFAGLALAGIMAVNPASAMVHATKFKWPEGSSLSVIKGKIDRWSGNGVLEAGGFLGLGNTHLKVIPQTVIVSSAGKRLTEQALKPGLQIASIYTVKNIAKPAASGTPTMGAANKVALVIVLDMRK